MGKHGQVSHNCRCSSSFAEIARRWTRPLHTCPEARKVHSSGGSLFRGMANVRTLNIRSLHLVLTFLGVFLHCALHTDKMQRKLSSIHFSMKTQHQNGMLGIGLWLAVISPAVMT